MGIKRLFLLFLGFSLFTGFAARATHLMGGDVAITNLGNDKFAIRVTAYRSCLGIPLGFSPINVKSACSNYNYSGAAGPIGGEDITPVCKSGCTRCNSSGCNFPFGAQRYYFDDTISLKNVNCCEFRVSWEQNARNSAITTGANDQNMYLESSFNKCLLKGNTPAFEFNPIIITCKDRCVSRFQSARRVEGDSLVYSLADPLSAHNTPIPYISGYSAKAPFKYKGAPDIDADISKCEGFHFNSQTGEMRFTPTNEDITVYAVNVQQWQKDSTGKWNKVSEVRQDVQTAVISCPTNTAPTISGMDSTSDTKAFLAIGKPVCFSVHSNDSDSKDSLSMRWNNSVPGATFDITNARLPHGKFCWTPSKKDAGKTYGFIVTVEEVNVCPLPTIVDKQFVLSVLDTFPAVKVSKNDSGCGGVCYAVNASGNTGLTYEWKVNGVKQTGTSSSFCYLLPTVGKYKIESIVKKGNYATQVYVDSVSFKLPPANAGKDTMICRGDSFHLQASGGKAYQWISAPGLSSTSIANPWVKPFSSQMYHVIVTDSNGCSAEDSVYIRIDTTCVWPGDANNDKVVSLKDVFNVGLAYKALGPKRANASNNFVPQASRDWGFAIRGVDYKYADCNGDGIINSSDLTAIGSNYKKSHPKGGIPDNDVNGIPLILHFDKDTFFASDTVAASVILGTSSKPANGAYGISLAYDYPGKYISSGTYALQTECNLFCDANGFQLDLDKPDLTGFTQEKVIVRVDGKGATGSGALGKLSFVLKDSTYNYASGGEWIYLSFTDAKLIDNKGDKLGVNAISDSALVFRSRSDVLSGIQGINALAKNVRLYPNPAKEKLVIEAGDFKVQSIRLTNQLGQELKLNAPVNNKGRYILDISHLPNGMYTLTLKNNSTAVSKRVLIQR